MRKPAILRLAIALALLSGCRSAPPADTIANILTNLTTWELRNTELRLTAAQREAMAPLLADLVGVEDIPAAMAKKHLTQMRRVLTREQRQAAEQAPTAGQGREGWQERISSRVPGEGGSGSGGTGTGRLPQGTGGSGSASGSGFVPGGGFMPGSGFGGLGAGGLGAVQAEGWIRVSLLAQRLLDVFARTDPQR